MTSGARLGLVLLGAVIVTATAPSAVQLPGTSSQPDYDIRDGRQGVPPRSLAVDAALLAQQSRPGTRARFNRHTGGVRVLDNPGFTIPRAIPNAAVNTALAANASWLGLEPRDVASLVAVRDYVSVSTGVRHAIFTQVVEGIPVFDSLIGLHVLADGTVARVTSNAAPIDGRRPAAPFSGTQAAAAAIADTGTTPDRVSRASRVWFALDGVLHLAWHVTAAALNTADVYDLLFDAETGELLLRRNRLRYAEATGRVQQSAAHDLGLPDPMPAGASECPPPVNYQLRSLTAPFRDSATVLANSGRLEGNNTRVFRGSSTTPSGPGTFDGAGWSFDFPFNTAASAETFLFFAMNFTHDFFYDLGFDEAAGNFQTDNFGRGGIGGDAIRARARADGRNNANYAHAFDGTAPTINMFLWDGSGCWAQDVDGDGQTDIDGDYDFDIVIHEFHHGVSLRLNTSFTGPEAGAIGEGGGDFFAYSVNGDTLLADYARPGGIRAVNSKTYADWTCAFWFSCEVHTNGEIWANVLWDLRERFRADGVGGSQSFAIQETHQLYIDALKLSPPSPTMLDMRDAILQADTLRNPGTPTSQNFCRIWETFAARGMGGTATDTADNGLNRVHAGFDVPSGCNGPPAPPTVSVAVNVATASEAGAVEAAVAIKRLSADDYALTVRFAVGGTATAAVDYAALASSATIAAGAFQAIVPIVPIDDAAFENNETVVVTILSDPAYAIGSPTSGTITIVSDDVAPDLIVSALTVPRVGGAATVIQVTDTTRNQGLGTAVASQTAFYLSPNALFDATDTLLGTRPVGELASGAASTATSTLTLPNVLPSGTYYVFAKADGPAAITESSEGNNTRIATIAIGPDLVISALTAPPMVAPDIPFSVSDTTANQGGGPAPVSQTRFFLSVNSILDASDVPLPQHSVPELAAGAASPGTTFVSVPAQTSVGTYYLVAQADAAGAAIESSESNNTRATTLRVGGDLTVSAFSAPLRAAAGSTIVVNDTTKNVGAGTVAASTTAFYLSTNLAVDAADILLQPSRSVPSLGANGISTASTTISVPPVTAGTWYLLANADSSNVVPETIETNNVRFTTIQIGPDLTVLSAVVPATAAAGGTITVTETVRNIGAADAPTTATRFYLSTNSTLDAADVLLTPARQVAELVAGASSTGTTLVTIPSQTPGAYYLLVVADGASSVPESSEANNTVARAIQIVSGS